MEASAINQNGIAVQFLINNRLFREPFAVETLWKFPFIPHAGESVDGKLWINASDFSPEKAEKNLTDLGHALLKQSGKALNQWLLDLSLTIGFVENVAYLCDDDDKLLILIVLTDLEIQTKTKYTRRQNNIIGNNICGSNIQINKTIM